MKASKIQYWWSGSGGTGITETQFNAFMDVFNAQTNDQATNVVLATNLVSSWLDLSGNSRHFNQATTGRKPVYSADGITFDAVDDRLLSGSEFTLSDGSIFIVFKNPDNSASRVIIASASEVNRIGHSTGNVSVSSNLGTEVGTWQLGGIGLYKVLWIVKNGATYTVGVNDRELTRANVAYTLSSAILKFFSIGFGTNSNLLSPASMRSISISTQIPDVTTRTNIINFLSTRYTVAPPSESCIIGFGDSWTQNTVSYPILPGLATAMGIPFINCGYTGTVVSNVTGASYNGEDRWAATLPLTPRAYKFYIMFGANDQGVVAITPTIYANAIQTIVSGLIARGYDPRSICICSPQYTMAYASTPAVTSKVDLMKAASFAVSTSLGVRWADVLQAIIDAGGDAVMADGLHPNATTGTTAVVNCINTAFQGA